jgi:hypothetical protein
MWGQPISMKHLNLSMFLFSCPHVPKVWPIMEAEDLLSLAAGINFPGEYPVFDGAWVQQLRACLSI